MNDQSLPAILTLEQTSQYLQLPVDDLRAELESKRIPALKIAGQWRIKRVVLDRLLDSTNSSGGPTLSSQRKVGARKTAESLYQQAALARTEGDYDKARQLFYKAIEAGGSPEVYTSFFKMERGRKVRDEALQIIEKAIITYPNHMPFYDMYGHLERRASHYERAEEIFRQGLTHFPSNANLLRGLAQTLVQIGTKVSLREAGDVYKALERDGKLDPSDGFYQHFKAFQNNPRANQ
jgi:tetratricopeptide (TPR) repeat protein